MRYLRWLWRYPLITATVLVLIGVGGLESADQPALARIAASVWVAAVVAGTLVGMVRDVLRGHVGLDVLAVTAMIAALAVGEYLAALVIVLMLAGGAALEDIASRRARRDLRALLDRSPRTAHVVKAAADGGEAVHDLSVTDVAVGDILLVRPAELVPVDAILLSDAAELDESSLTGESLPVQRAGGDEVYSGAVNGAHAIRVRALRVSADSQYQQIVALVHAAEQSRAPVVRLADRFAVPFTAVSLVLAGTAWALSGDPVRFAEVLVLATPCPLLIAAPVAFLAGLSRAAKSGVIIKSGAVIEQLARVRSAAFDKTGTLTWGRPALVDVLPAEGFEAADVLRLAASAEQYSTHVLAEGVRRAAVDRGLALITADDAFEHATNGVTARIHGQSVSVGKPAYVESLVGSCPRASLLSGQAAAYVAVDSRFAGTIVLADEPRPDAALVVSWLRAHQVDRLCVFTGDVRETAESVAAAVGLDEVRAELLPGDKVRLAAQLQPRPMMMVGDGVNDAPALAAADVGVAMGARGATAAGDAADVVILTDALAPVADAVAIARHTLRVALIAIGIGIGLSLALMLVAMTGLIPAIIGALIQEGVDLATIVFALRALAVRRVDLSGPPRAAQREAPRTA